MKVAKRLIKWAGIGLLFLAGGYVLAVLMLLASGASKWVGW